MTIKLLSALSALSLVLGAPLTQTQPADPLHTHTLQLNLELVESEYQKAAPHGPIQVDGAPHPVASYAGPIGYGNKAINAPFNCQGENTHEGCFADFESPFDPNRCAQRCSEHTQYNLAHGKPDRVCRFFNTYLLSKNGESYAQYCSIYTQRWDAGYATNPGQFSNGANYTVSNSVGYYNETDPGPCQGGGTTSTTKTISFTTTSQTTSPTTRSTTTNPPTSTHPTTSHPTTTRSTTTNPPTSTHPTSTTLPTTSPPTTTRSTTTNPPTSTHPTSQQPQQQLHGLLQQPQGQQPRQQLQSQQPQ
ncbi:hypothetical protein GGS20DRAFT_588458 [Poronia punctata]|nr:hypothetical protein GGS20DRAFT_588458 [Poronia punctata]